MKRKGIYGRDEYRCVYCGLQFPEDELTLDHVQPRVRGGDRSEGNLVTACKGCKTLKGQRRLSVFLYENSVARANFLRVMEIDRCVPGSEERAKPERTRALC